MAIYKVTYDFEYEQTGWTETYYNTYAEIRTSMESAKGLLERRRLLLGGDALLDYPRITTIRISNVAIQRDAIQYKVPVSSGANKSANASPDSAQLSVAVRCEATDLYRRTLYLAGNPDSVCAYGKYLAVPIWENAFIQFKEFLLARPWGIYCQNKASAAVNVADIPPPLGGETTITTHEPHGLAIGDFVQVLKAPGLRNLRGKYAVKTIISPNAFKIVATPEGLYTAGGKVRKVDMIMQAFTNMEIDGITRRGRGRPLGGPVGRRKRRVVA